MTVRNDGPTAAPAGRRPRGKNSAEWLEAIRPRTLHAGIAPVLVGGALAASHGAFAILPFLAALTGALLLQVGTNLANDYSDFVRGADAPDRVGFVRASQSGRIMPVRVRAAAAGVFGLAVVVGAYLVHVGGWPILVIGVAAIAAGVAYTGGPWPYGYHGLGDAFVLLFFGPVAVAGTYWVQVLDFRFDLLLAGLGVGAFVTAILVVNNLRDLRTDARAGKRTLAVLLGERGTRWEYGVLILTAAVVPPAGVVLAGWSPGALLAVAALLLAIRPFRTVRGYRDPRELNAALERTAKASGAYGVLLAVGLLV